MHESILNFDESCLAERGQACCFGGVKMKPQIFFAVLGMLAADTALASRQGAPIVPPGQAIKCTRSDYKEKEEREAERENRLEELEERLEDNEAEREAKRIEREQIEAAREAERQAEALKKAQAPEDFVGDAKKVQMSEAPKAASVHEKVVQQAPVAAAAKKVVARRAR